MNSKEIRQAFLDFFESKEHKIVPSSPIVNKDDPTLMFTNAGMNQFKDFFLGNRTPDFRRAADTQKCLRASGKHNDLEDVGVDSYHHTMFEMLGNWSFGDYFKKEAIDWAWELLTEVYKIPKDRLYVSIFEGDKSEGLEIDSEAIEYWKKHVPADRILPFDKKDNFWEMGETGPCGPCSEIHVDLRKDEDRKKVDGATLVNMDDPLVIEIWNLVFIQFNRKADRSLENLPEKHVDTGMGFERLCMAIQGTTSNYDTDVFSPFIQLLEKESGIKYTFSYEKDAKTDMAMRVVVDHLRAVSFAIADGLRPSNNGAGYVIRRILRRAVRYYYSFLNINEPLLYKLLPLFAETFQDVFPEVKEQLGFVTKQILAEEKQFLRTLSSGLKRINHFFDHSVVSSSVATYLKAQGLKAEEGVRVGDKLNADVSVLLPNGKYFVIEVKNLKNEELIEKGNKQLKKYTALENVEDGILINWEDSEEEIVAALNQIDFGKTFDPKIELNKVLSGKDAFTLFDTYGFPIDLTRLIASEKGWEVNEESYEAERERARELAKKDAEKSYGDWHSLFDADGVEFTGYDTLYSDDSRMARYRTVEVKKKEQYQIVLDKTPFYAESGGQVGDKGLLWFDDEKIAVINTQKENDLIIHLVNKLPENKKAFVRAEVNETRRSLVENNHSATHLLHAALREVLGDHVQQRGSFLDDKYLRFDFSHHEGLTADEISQVEKIVNERIRENIPLQEKRSIPIAEAQASGAMMLFGEKYGDTVRMITFNSEYSIELCGGTHVPFTGKIGYFKIKSEGSVASGIRRIEAITADKTEEYLNKELNTLNELRGLFKNPKDVVGTVTKLQDENKTLQKEIEKLLAAQASALQGGLRAQFEEINGINVLTAKLPLGDTNAIKTLGNALEQEKGNALIVFGAVVKDKPQLMVIVSRNLVENKGVHAGNMIRTLAKEIKGGGGGQPFFATAGGKDVNGLENALSLVKGLI